MTRKCGVKGCYRDDCGKCGYRLPTLPWTCYADSCDRTDCTGCPVKPKRDAYHAGRELAARRIAEGLKVD